MLESHTFNTCRHSRRHLVLLTSVLCIFGDHKTIALSKYHSILFVQISRICVKDFILSNLSKYFYLSGPM